MLLKMDDSITNKKAGASKPSPMPINPILRKMMIFRGIVRTKACPKPAAPKNVVSELNPGVKSLNVRHSKIAEECIEQPKSTLLGPRKMLSLKSKRITKTRLTAGLIKKMCSCLSTESTSSAS